MLNEGKIMCIRILVAGVMSSLHCRSLDEISIKQITTSLLLIHLRTICGVSLCPSTSPSPILERCIHLHKTFIFLKSFFLSKVPCVFSKNPNISELIKARYLELIIGQLLHSVLQNHQHLRLLGHILLDTYKPMKGSMLLVGEK